MPKKKTNEIVEEQRRAREEFLELKRMQNGEMPTGPKPSEEAVLPKTFGEKLKNIWYHDKYVILGSLAAVIVIIILVAQCCSRVEADLQLVLFTYTPVSDDACDRISKFAEKYCEDINGDGKVKVQVINCSFSETGDMQYKYTIMQKLQATLAANDNALLYIVDDKGEKYFTESDGALSGCFDSDFIPLGQAFYSACQTGSESNALSLPLPENLKIACRKTDAQAFKKSKNLEECVKSSKAIIEIATKE